jgi:hypothetical protein
MDAVRRGYQSHKNYMWKRPKRKEEYVYYLIGKV